MGVGYLRTLCSGLNKPLHPISFRFLQSQRQRAAQWVFITMAASGSSASSSLSPAPSPPYPAAGRIADSLCFSEYTASLKCLERNGDKSKCQEQFDNYKECKKREREARLERNRKRSFFQ